MHHRVMLALVVYLIRARRGGREGIEIDGQEHSHERPKLQTDNITLSPYHRHPR